jgi:hypothetical protein
LTSQTEFKPASGHILLPQPPLPVTNAQLLPEPHPPPQQQQVSWGADVDVLVGFDMHVPVEWSHLNPAQQETRSQSSPSFAQVGVEVVVDVVGVGVSHLLAPWHDSPGHSALVVHQHTSANEQQQQFCGLYVDVSVGIY